MTNAKYYELPVLPLRGLMIFPNTVLHFDVGRPRSVAALERGMAEGQKLFLVTQKDEEKEDPRPEDLCGVGTIASIRQVMNLPGENIRILVEGESRGVMEEVLENDTYLRGRIRACKDRVVRSMEGKALVRTTQDLFATFAATSQRVSQDTVDGVRNIERPGELADLLAANILTKLEEKQQMPYLSVLADMYRNKGESEKAEAIETKINDFTEKLKAKQE